MWSLKPGFGAVMLVMVTKSSPCAFSLSLSLSPSLFFSCSWGRVIPKQGQVYEFFSKSLDHRQKLIGLRLGTKFFIYGMNGSKTLSQMHTPIHGLMILCHMHILVEVGNTCSRFTYLHIGGLNVCCRGILFLLVLVAWAVHDIRGNHFFFTLHVYSGTQIFDRGGIRLWMTLCGTQV